MDGLVTTRPHYVRANHANRVPRRFVYLDAEAVETEDAGQWVQTFRLAVTAHDGWDERRKEAKPVEWVDHDDPAALWAYVDGCSRRKSRLVVVAHNLGYDLRITRALYELPALGWVVDHMAVGGRSLTMTMRRDNRTLILVDSASIWPTSLAKVGALIGQGKTALPDSDADQAAWFRRCRRDVEILRDAYRQILDWIERDDLGNWQKSGAGMAWAHWRHRHLTHRVLVHGDGDARAAEVDAIGAGRCEAWRWGRLVGQSWVEWDLPLAYPRVALDTYLPTELLGHMGRPTLAWLERLKPDRLALVRAVVDQPLPVLATRAPQGTLWPVGQVEGWYWAPEVLSAAQAGAQVRLSAAWVYRGALALRSWAQWVIDAVEGRNDDLTPLQRATAKHWARALIGRFGAKYPVWAPWGQAPTPGLELGQLWDAERQLAGKTLTLGERFYATTDERYVADACPAILGAVMAECRRRLWSLMNVAGLTSVAYVDTDSLIVDMAGSERLAALVASGGGWGLRRKQRWRSLDVLGPRQLILDGNGRIAGVPSNAQRVERYRWAGELWQGVESTLASKHPDQVRVRPASWQVTGRDNRRRHLPDGLTAPFAAGDLLGCLSADAS